MPCFYPMEMRLDGKTASGKNRYIMTGRFYGVKSRFTDIVVPCGQCRGCRMDRSREWANRMMLELPYHEHNYFLTLTYDEEHVPRSYYLADDDGVVDEDVECLTLKPEDMTAFLKRLRRWQEYKFGKHDFRYYYCGEYGSQTHRPHYHMIAYDLELPDLEVGGKTELGFQYLRSQKLDELWGNGYVGISDVTWETCAYVARYILKKLNGDAAEFYRTFNLVPEFVRMSLKPAIGKRWYEEHGDEIYKNDEILIKTKERGIKSKPPHYFDRLYDLEYPEQMSMIKANRKKVAEMAVEAQLAGWHGSYTDYLATKETNFNKKTEIFMKRSALE